MPKRMVDGEALWTSGKLKRVQPQEFRLHYANWLPLAEANGVFEVDFDIIRARVYPVLDPGFCSENVRHVYEEFVRVGLLQVWDESGKTWAYFVGIDKSGRLPADAHLKRYKGLPPNPPIIPDQSGTGPGPDRINPQGFGLVCIGMDRVGEEDMSIKNSLTDLSRAILGVRIGPQDSNWTEIKALVRVYGEDAVTAKFEEWAKSQTQAPSYPLSGFVRVADSLLTDKFASAVSPEDLSALINQLTRISDNRVIFNNKQRAVIAIFLDQNSADDVISVFREYFGNISGDEFKMSGAAREFTEGLASLLYTQSERRKEVARTVEQIRVCTENEQRLAREQAEKALKEAEELDSLIEDTLEA